jgi:hypothetical protein
MIVNQSGSRLWIDPAVRRSCAMLPSVAEPETSPASLVEIAILHEGERVFAEIYAVRDRAEMGRAVFHAHSAARTLRADLDPTALRAAVASRNALQ